MRNTIAIFLIGLLSSLLFYKIGVSETMDIFVKPPAYPERIFPCARCHDYVPVKKQQHTLAMNHADIVLEHAEEQRWCLDCHNAEDRNKLRLLNQKVIDFSKSYELCGQCHGTILRNWKAGVHGKRIGMWNGKKLYRLCISCHNPHQPKFKPVKPQSRPLKPLEINLVAQ